MNTAIPAARACGGCGMGMLRPTNVAGMVMGHREDPNVRVLGDLVLPVCDVCGDMALDPQHAEALDAGSYRRTRLRTSRH